jgi:hypothetical protein
MCVSTRGQHRFPSVLRQTAWTSRGNCLPPTFALLRRAYRHRGAPKWRRVTRSKRGSRAATVKESLQKCIAIRAGDDSGDDLHIKFELGTRIVLDRLKEIAIQSKNRALFVITEGVAPDTRVTAYGIIFPGGRTIEHVIRR